MQKKKYATSAKFHLFGKRSFEDFSRDAQLIDGQYMTACVSCGEMLSAKDYEAGHDVPQVLNGSNTANNHLVLCNPKINGCNRRQGTKTGLQFLGETKYSEVLKRRALPVRKDVVEELNEQACIASKSWLRRHGNLGQKARLAHLHNR